MNVAQLWIYLKRKKTVKFTLNMGKFHSNMNVRKKTKMGHAYTHTYTHACAPLINT